VPDFETKYVNRFEEQSLVRVSDRDTEIKLKAAIIRYPFLLVAANQPRLLRSVIERRADRNEGG